MIHFRTWMLLEQRRLTSALSKKEKNFYMYVSMDSKWVVLLNHWASSIKFGTVLFTIVLNESSSE